MQYNDLEVRISSRMYNLASLKMDTGGCTLSISNKEQVFGVIGKNWYISD